MSAWFEARAKMRRGVHAAFAVEATYEDADVVVPVPITVRWGAEKQVRAGNLDSGDYAEIIESIDRLHFDSEELATKGVAIRRGGIVTLTEFTNAKFELDVREQADGPIRITWTVTRFGVVQP
jgi:hypothetical protein